MTDQPASLAAALAELQTQLPHVGKDADGMVRDGKRLKYADLAAISHKILPLMGALGLSFMAMPDLNSGAEGTFHLRYVLQHVSGDRETGLYPLPVSGTPQQIGSAITYARRYCLCAVTGVAPDDDDDDGEEGGKAKPQRARAKVTGPEHERLRHGTVEPTPDDRPATRVKAGQNGGGDPWQDQPPGHFEETPPEERTGSIDGRQRSQIFAKLTILGITDANAQRETLAGILRRPVSSRASLSYRDAEDVLKDLQGRVEAKEAAEEAAEQDAAAEVTP